MEDLFNKLQKDGKNNVDNLVKWMRESHVITVDSNQEDIERSEFPGIEKIRTLFGETRESDNVPLDEFKDVLKKIATEQKKGIDELTQQLADDGPKVIKAAIAGVSAFKKVIMKDD